MQPPITRIDARITANETQNDRFRLPEAHNAWLFEAPIFGQDRWHERVLPLDQVTLEIMRTTLVPTVPTTTVE